MTKDEPYDTTAVLQAGSFSAGMPGNGVPKVILTVGLGTMFPKTQ